MNPLFESSGWRIFQVTLIGIALYAAWWHASKSTTGPDEKSLYFLILALILLVTPMLDKITFWGSASVEFKKDVKADVADLTQSTAQDKLQIALAATAIADAQRSLALVMRDEGLTDLDKARESALALEQTSSGIANLLRPGPKPPAPAEPPSPKPPDAARAASPKVSTAARAPNPEPPALAMAANANAAAPAEQIRLSAWIQAGENALRYCAGWSSEGNTALANSVNRREDGDPAWLAFDGRQPLSYESRPPDCHPPTDGKTVYRAMYVVPMFSLTGAIGVFIAEREKPIRFDAPAEALISALADLYTSALV
jgi:hypothetical protein